MKGSIRFPLTKGTHEILNKGRGELRNFKILTSTEAFVATDLDM
jgi:hypothetical protein